MTVKELMMQLNKLPQNAVITINGAQEIEMVWNSPTTNTVDINTVPIESDIDAMEKDDFFYALAEEVEKSDAEIAFDEMMGGLSEMLDAMKINGVR